MARKLKDENNLSDLEQKFIDIWFTNGFNGSDAYRRAKPNATIETARVEGSKLLAKPNVADEVAKRKEQIRQDEEIKLGSLVTKLKNLMYECIQDSDRGNLLKTIELLGKFGGHFETKHKVTGDLKHSGTIDVIKLIGPEPKTLND
jgi:hypothetical protein